MRRCPRRPIARPVQSYAIRLTLASSRFRVRHPLVQTLRALRRQPARAQAVVLVGRSMRNRGQAFVSATTSGAWRAALRHRILLTSKEKQTSQHGHDVEEMLAQVSPVRHVDSNSNFNSQREFVTRSSTGFPWKLGMGIGLKEGPSEALRFDDHS